MTPTVSTNGDPSRAVVLEILQRLWQTKLNSIALLERWRSETQDTEIQAGLASQVIDERRHTTMIGEEIRRLGGRIGGQVGRDAVGRIFADAESNRDDVQRMFALYRGVKAYTVDRCSHLMPYVDTALAQTLDRLTRDEVRHIRWADVRLERLLTHDKMRECNLLLGRVWSSLEFAWGKQWRQLPWGGVRRRSA
jgi:hypothetical protein